MVDFGLEGEDGRFEGVFFREGEEEFKVTALEKRREYVSKEEDSCREGSWESYRVRRLFRTIHEDFPDMNVSFVDQAYLGACRRIVRHFIKLLEGRSEEGDIRIQRRRENACLHDTFVSTTGHYEP